MDGATLDVWCHLGNNMLERLGSWLSILLVGKKNVVMYKTKEANLNGRSLAFETVHFGASIFPLKDVHDKMRARHAFTNETNETLLAKLKINICTHFLVPSMNAVKTSLGLN